MTIRFDVVGLIVSDMARSLAFDRRLGLELPSDADSQPHVETTLPGGIRLAWDTEDTARSFDPDWQPPSRGRRTSLAFDCGDPAGVDPMYSELVEAGDDDGQIAGII